jgi:hypothetical protein
MNRVSRTLLIATLAACVGMAGALNADSAYYTAGVYRFKYATTADLDLAKAIGKYASHSRAAAILSVGNRYGYSGFIDVNLTKQGINGILGSATPGKTQITLNTSYNFTGAKWGSTLAHETSHVYFYQYIGAVKWNASTDMLYCRTFLTESLAWYAGEVAYADGPRYSASVIKSNLKKFTVQELGPGGFMTFFGTGYHYKNGGYFGSTTQWQLRAQGYFFVNQLGGTAKLMEKLRHYTSYAGSYILSSTYTTAYYYFELSFKEAYGKLANANGIYDFKCQNQNYLMGVFWYNWIR